MLGFKTNGPLVLIPVVLLLVGVGAQVADAAPTQKLTLTQIKPLLLTAAEAQAATGPWVIDATVTCAKRPVANQCSSAYTSQMGRASASRAIIDSVASSKVARSLIKERITRDVGRVKVTVLSKSASEVVFRHDAGIGNVFVAISRANGDKVITARCSRPAKVSDNAAIACARALLVAQVAKAG